MYPRNAGTPPRIAIGPVVQISDGAVQTSGVSIKISHAGDLTGTAGTNSATYVEGIVHYAPTQPETNYTAFTVTAYKTACIPCSVTVVTTASATAGQVDVGMWKGSAAPAMTGDAYAVVAHATYGNAAIVETFPTNFNDLSIEEMTGRVTLRDGTITSARFDGSTAFPITSADSGSTAIARTGADSDTLETLSDEIAAVKSDTANILADTGTDGVKIADSAIGNDTYDNMTAYPLKYPDADSTKIARTGADSDTLETLSDEIASCYTGTPPTADTIADTVWNETIADHSSVGSTGAALAAAGGSGDPWATALPGSYSSGQAGKIVGDNINATISSRSSHDAAAVVTALGTGSTLSALATASALTTTSAVVDAIKVTTDKLDTIVEEIT